MSHWTWVTNPTHWTVEKPKWKWRTCGKVAYCYATSTCDATVVNFEEMGYCHVYVSRVYSPETIPLTGIKWIKLDRRKDGTWRKASQYMGFGEVQVGGHYLNFDPEDAYQTYVARLVVE